MTNLLLELYKYLKQLDADIYFIGQHQGFIDKPSVIIIPGSEVPQMGTNKLIAQGIEIRAMVNIDSFAEIERFKELIKEHMEKNKNFIKTGYESPVLIDDNKKAYYRDIEYSLLKEMN